MSRTGIYIAKVKSPREIRIRSADDEELDAINLEQRQAEEGITATLAIIGLCVGAYLVGIGVAYLAEFVRLWLLG